MADYPDWTELVNIVGTDIMVAIDLQGAYIMMPVDIQAQYLTLEIDIVAQTVGNIAIDLAAQSVGAISVDITAQTIAQLDINIDAQNVGVYLQPDWQALQGKQKTFLASGTNKASGEYATAPYTVTNGKTLYICHISAGIWATAAANRDLNQMLYLAIFSETAGGIVCTLGGNGGCSLALPTPIKELQNKQIMLIISNASNHNCELQATMVGYEI